MSEPDDNDLTVSVESLAIDGVRPSEGDTVELKVTGRVRKLVNDTAFVTPETVNDQPMPSKPETSEEEDYMAAAHKADQQAMAMPM